MADVFRLLTIFLGGGVIGIGLVVLAERARFYHRNELPQARLAMYMLMAANTMMLIFVAAAILYRWDEPLTWRTPFAFVLFTIKGAFFMLLRDAGVEQERRLMYGEQQHARSWRD